MVHKMVTQLWNQIKSVTSFFFLTWVLCLAKEDKIWNILSHLSVFATGMNFSAFGQGGPAIGFLTPLSILRWTTVTWIPQMNTANTWTTDDKIKVISRASADGINISQDFLSFLSFRIISKSTVILNSD